MTFSIFPNLNCSRALRISSSIMGSKVEEGGYAGSLPAPSPPRAAILAIGSAVPPYVMKQSTFPDFYFNITDSKHMHQLKNKFKIICEKSMIEKRHLCLTEDMMRKEPAWTAYQSSSFNLRQDFMNEEIPRLGHEAAVAAVKKWGRPASEITHLIVSSTGAVDIPGADYHILSSMGLSPTTKRFMLSQVGCHGGGTVLRLAKDLAENNPGARVLGVCSEVTASGFRGPCESHVENLIGQALFGDGASAVIVGAPPFFDDETATFELLSATQHLIPNTDQQIVARFREEGVVHSLHRDIAETIATNIEMILKGGLRSAGISPPADDWNSLFWVVHPGGRAILDKMETKLGLRPEKLRATREVLRQYGNVLSACLFMVMEEMKEWSENEKKMTAGEGDEVGVFLGFGPGLTVETVVIRCPLNIIYK